MTTGNEWALHKGNDFPIRLTLTSDHGDVVTGLPVSVYFADGPYPGGTPITTPATAVDLDEDTSTPTDARDYEGSLDAEIVDQLVEAALTAGRAHCWLAVKIPGDLLAWRQIPVAKHRVIA